MKKIISALLALVLSASLTACGNTDVNDTADDENMGTVSTAEAKEYYDLAKAHLTEYLENDYLFVNGEGWFYEHDASEYLYKEFEALGDYEDSAQILAQFVTDDDGRHIYLPRAYQTAQAYLEEYCTGNGFHTDSNGHFYGDAALTYLYNEFKTLGDYEDSEEIFAQFVTRDDGKMIYIPQSYKAAIEDLEEYLEKGHIYIDSQYVSGHAALEYLCKEFEACGDYEDSKEILSRFTVLPDMLVSITNTKTDNLGNVSNNNYGAYYIDEFGRLSFYDSKYSYDERGTLTEYNNPIVKFFGIAHYRYEYEYEYDEVGNITKVMAIRWDNIEIITTPEYDANGNIVKATTQTNEDTYTNTYTYDAQNRLIAAEKATMDSYGNFFYPTSYTYSYDEKGNLTEENYLYTDEDAREYKYKITYSYDEKGNLTEASYSGRTKWLDDYEGKITYSYDENGYLVEMKETFTEDLGTSDEDQTVFQFLYTNDENGRPISAELIETEDGKNSYASQILTYHYETLYFYDAE